MSPSVLSGCVYGVLASSCAFGMWLNARLPEHHLSDETKETVRMGMGSVATMAALVLGLLVASAKGTYDAEKSEVIQIAAKIVFLDKTLANCGPEAKEARRLLRVATATAVGRIWADERRAGGEKDPGAVWSRELPMAVQAFPASSDSARAFQAQAQEIVADLGQMRWLLFEQSESSISLTLLAFLISWLALMFVSIGLFAPVNATSILSQMLAALSVAGAIFLILELDHSFDGVIRISSKPLLSALSQMGV